jgi:hypothetical protein
MFQTLVHLLAVAPNTITFGATVIYCDANKQCSVLDAGDLTADTRADAQTQTAVSHA